MNAEPPAMRLEFASALAVEAGRLAHTAFGRSTVSAKGRHDVVTEMDREVERFIRAAIAQRYPDEAIVGEEEGGRGASRMWILDPIDGTANYARGIPHYCVSIAFLEDAVPLVGVLHDPSHDLVYAARRGAGATCNGRAIGVSACADIDAATVECGWSVRRSTAAYLALVERVMKAGAAMRRAGSGALGLADVAAGRVEAYCELHINAWDCAAGILLVDEAGGCTNDFFAADGLTAGNALLACNASLCATLADVVGIPITR
ncbi:MAG TPA: inositol monophosphatase family protein [Casimicrobiaceae bacterium]|nr:inositol monophosphatase family protein [Casimicrobiaceae bacterium]